jgi:hypothetical protein
MKKYTTLNATYMQQRYYIKQQNNNPCKYSLYYNNAQKSPFQMKKNTEKSISLNQGA